MDRTAFMTTTPLEARIVANGRDASDRSPVVAARCEPGGTGRRALRHGAGVRGRWRFPIIPQTRIDGEGPEGAPRRVIAGLGTQGCRKIGIDAGVEFVHQPRSAA